MLGAELTTRSQILVENESPELVFAQTVYDWLLATSVGVPERVHRWLFTESPWGNDGETSQDEIVEITGRQEPGSSFIPFPVPITVPDTNLLLFP